jgi:hypothetical protein
MPTLSLYRLAAPLGSIKVKPNRDGMRRTRHQFDYGAVAGALILVGLLLVIIWS